MKMNKFNMFITSVCVLFLIKLRWPKNKSIYDTINYSHVTRLIRFYGSYNMMNEEQLITINNFHGCQVISNYQLSQNFPEPRCNVPQAEPITDDF